MSPTMDISTQDLEQAISIRRQIDALEQRLASLIGRSRGSARPHPAARPAAASGKRFSAATRAKLAAAARARWARVRSGKSTTSAPKKKKGGITAAGRRRLSQLMRARWAARRKGKG